jgi:hypothetical protein
VQEYVIEITCVRKVTSDKYNNKDLGQNLREFAVSNRTLLATNPFSPVIEEILIEEYSEIKVTRSL